jgi:hypothetical protein
MRTRKATLGTAAVLGALTLAGIYFIRTPTDAPAPAAGAPEPLQAALQQAQAWPASLGTARTAAAHPFTAEDRVFIAGLRDKFGPRLGTTHAQVKLVEQLMAYLMANYPDGGSALLAAFLKELYPERAEELFAQFLKLVSYNDWLRAERENLRHMSPADRRTALWQARRKAFGEAADEIWAAEIRSATIADSLTALETAEGLSTGEKLAAYLASVTQAYGADAPRFIENRQTELMNSFLDVASVQNDLHAMAPMERAATLRQIRGALGMDEAALDRWEALDRQRDQAWSAGEEYMQERQRILTQYQGAERQAQLAQLQDRVLGAEAEVIRSEETAGFYRYEHRRRFGRE